VSVAESGDVLPNLQSHFCDLLEHWSERLLQSRRHDCETSLGKTPCRGSRHPIATGLGKSAHCVHRSCTQPNKKIPGTDQREGFLWLDSPVCNRPEYLRIESGITGQVGYDHFMSKLLQLLAYPDRVGSSLHRHACGRHIGKPLLNRLRCGSETTSIDYFSILVEVR